MQFGKKVDLLIRKITIKITRPGKAVKIKRKKANKAK